MTNSNHDAVLTDGIGRLMANMWALEFAIRVTLYTMETPAAERRPPSWRFAALAVGDQLPDDRITSWDSLGQLIAAYNDREASRGPDALVPTGIVDLRDALAHGRVLSDTPDGPKVLVRFARPMAGVVAVTEKHTLSPAWLNEQLALVYREVVKVYTRLHEITTR